MAHLFLNIQFSTRSALVGWILIIPASCSKPSTVAPFAENRVEATGLIDGEEYKLADDGNVYRVVEDGKGWSFHAKLYDPVEVANSYVVEDQQVFRVSPDNRKRYLTSRNFSESFEDLGEGEVGLRNLVAEGRNRWGSFTLQSEATPTVEDYVQLRQQILSNQSGFLDAVVAPSQDKAHSGVSSLKCVADAKTDDMITSKSSLSTPLVYFKGGDDFWLEASFYVEGARPLTLMDLECEFAELHPGIRLMIFESGHLGAELKALDKPKFEQAAENAIEFPMDRWVLVKAHFGLSTKNGVVEIWQDGKKVVDAAGTTLPFRSAIYNSLEIGISAHSFGSQASTLYVDDIQISDSVIGNSPEDLTTQ